MAMNEQTWANVASKKRTSILAKVPKEWMIVVSSRTEPKDVTGPYIEQYLTDEEIEITNADMVTILSRVRVGQWSARAVTRAFCHRAALAHQLTGCLHEMRFEEAIADAEALDRYFHEHQKTVGPLHGLPISVKDQFHISGMETTMGYVGWIGTFEGKPRTEENRMFESQVVRVLRHYGAVFFCKTSVTQALMSGETVNNIIGYTFNPKNRHLSAGGSSGGEGALIGLRGSPIGFGSDIGGSIRVPAAFNGLYGIRPSVGRLPYRGIPISMDGQESVPCVIGPIATTIESLKLMFKTVLQSNPWVEDPLVLELPWRQDHEDAILKKCYREDSTPGLCIGIFEHDGVVGLDPPVKRALRTVERVLRADGHNIIEWQPPSHQDGWDIAYETWTFDGGKDIHTSLAKSGEPIAPQLEIAFGSSPGEEKTATSVAASNIKLREYRAQYLDYWNSTAALTGTDRPADAFISAIAPFAAPLPEQYTHNAYSTVINVLDYAATVLPVMTADQNLDVADANYQPLNSKDRIRHKNYNAELYDGAHVGIQIVCRRLEEERVIALTEYIDSLLRRMSM